MAGELTKKVIRTIQDAAKNSRERTDHSKYNSVERCWGILEQHWNGAILNSIEAVLSWARSMTWKGVSPIVRLLDKTYETGVRLNKKGISAYC